MLGPLSLTRNAAACDLPASRKVRALLAYLALSPKSVPRSRLCELLWDVADDPRAELRWCLAKLRPFLTVIASGDTLALDLDEVSVDALALAKAAETGFETLAADALSDLLTLSSGAFMEGLEIERCPQFNAWLTGQRRRFDGYRLAILERLAELLAPDAALPVLEAWVELTPFDLRAQTALLRCLATQGRLQEGERHLDAAIRLFESESQDSRPLREAWRQAKTSHAVPLQLSQPQAPAQESLRPNRATLAVMPLRALDGGAALPGGIAAGLTSDIITRLAKLRHFFVIAQGSVFALAEQNLDIAEAARKLDVDYVAAGAVRRRDSRLAVTMDLMEARTGRLVWSEVFERKADDLFAVLDEIGNSIVSSIAAEIETAERNCAVLKPPSSLNAWEAYHRGLWHMYRFTKDENAAARHFFETAIRLDPTFSRAHAGLSFTYWQSAFQRWDDHARDITEAFEAAGQSLIVDDRDPVAHWAMGRALWLRGRNDDSLSELNRAVDLSPNFALGHYAVSFVQSQAGDPRAAIEASDHSRKLSPFDPLLFGMYGTRAMAHARLGEYEAAAEWALKAAARPNSHANILAIAAHCLALAGRVEEGRRLVAEIRRSRPDYRCDDFLATFNFQPESAALFRHGGQRLGLN